MASAVIFLILAVVCFLISRGLSHLNDAPPGTAAVGTITRVTRPEMYTIYYVRFTDGAQTYEGQSVYYAETHGKYQAGDTVPIEYYFAKNHVARVRILDEDLEGVGGAASPAAKLCLALSCMMLLLALYTGWRSLR